MGGSRDRGAGVSGSRRSRTRGAVIRPAEVSFAGSRLHARQIGRRRETVVPSHCQRRARLTLMTSRCSHARARAPRPCDAYVACRQFATEHDRESQRAATTATCGRDSCARRGPWRGPFEADDGCLLAGHLAVEPEDDRHARDELCIDLRDARHAPSPIHSEVVELPRPIPTGTHHRTIEALDRVRSRTRDIRRRPDPDNGARSEAQHQEAAGRRSLRVRTGGIRRRRRRVAVLSHARGSSERSAV